MHPGEAEMHKKKAIEAEKAEYWKNRNEGKRGQGVEIQTQELVRPSNVAIIRTQDKKGKITRLAMSRHERRKMGVDIRLLPEK